MIWLSHMLRIIFYGAILHINHLGKSQDPSFEGRSKNLPSNTWDLSRGMAGRSLRTSKGKSQEKMDIFEKTNLSSVQGSYL